MSPKGLLLTYNAPNPGDGAGAQFQRILGIYGAAKSNNLGYLHSPILHLGANAGDSFESIESRRNFTNELNRKIRLNSDECFRKQKTFCLRRINNFVFPLLRPARRLLEFLNFSVILKIDSALQWVDANVWSYEASISALHESFVGQRPNARELIVDLHVRRAGIAKQDLTGQDYGRWTPTYWYENVLKEISLVCKSSGEEMVIRVHTDTLDRGMSWRPPKDISPDTIQHWESIGVLSARGEVTGEYEDFTELFSRFGKVEIVRDIDAIQAWKMMIESDILVIAKSSMSYVAALFRVAKPVFFAKFWHTGMSNWNDIEINKLLSLEDQAKITRATSLAIKQKRAYQI